MKDIAEELKKTKFEELANNYAQKAYFYVRPNGDGYSIKETDIQEILGLITLGVDNYYPIFRNGSYEMVLHTIQDFKDILAEIKAYLEPIKISYFEKKMQLNALTLPEDVENFDTNI